MSDLFSPCSSHGGYTDGLRACVQTCLSRRPATWRLPCALPSQTSSRYLSANWTGLCLGVKMFGCLEWDLSLTSVGLDASSPITGADIAVGGCRAEGAAAWPCPAGCCLARASLATPSWRFPTQSWPLSKVRRNRPPSRARTVCSWLAHCAAYIPAVKPSLPTVQTSCLLCCHPCSP